MSFIFSENKAACVYSKKHYIFGQNEKASMFDRILMGSWRAAEHQGACNYKISDCDMISKTLVIGKSQFIVTLNEKRFSKRRKPQTLTTLNQPFNMDNFNFTKVNEREILMTLALDEKEKSETHSKTPSVVMVNASPFQEGHSLMVPELNSCHNQRIRPQPLRTALDCLLISSAATAIAAFNSLLACASVNHLHFHIWINDEPVTAAILNLEHLTTTTTGEPFFHMPDHPVENIVVTIDGVDQVDAACKRLWKAIEVLQRLQLAHSIVWLREHTSSADHVTVRGILWPRHTDQSAASSKSLMPSLDDGGLINVACAELAGQVYTGDRLHFNNHMDADLLLASFQRTRVTSCVWQQIITKLSNI